ncbi:MAG: FecR family protein [Patescibacteria group bacterium]
MNPQPPARSSKDYILPFLIIVSLGVVAALSIRLWGLSGENENGGRLGISGKAELTEITGEVAVYLPATESWKIVGAVSSLSSGEGVKTEADGKAVLAFDDGTILTLDAGSEIMIRELQNSMTKKTIDLDLARGSAWIVAGTANSDFIITSNFLSVCDTAGSFLMTTNEKEDVISVISGGATTTILDPQKPKSPELKSFVLEPGQTLEVSERRVNLLRIGGELDLVKATPDEIKSSNFYLAMTGGATEGTEKTETAETPGEEEAEGTADPINLPAPLVITENGNIAASSEPVKVEGKVSPAAAKVEVQFDADTPYALGQFKAGSGEWSYNASTGFGNLKAGLNNYKVVAIDADGNRSLPTLFQISYSPTSPAEDTETEDSTNESEGGTDQEPESTTQSTDGVPAIGSSTFAPPEVTEPLDGATITETPVHFSGTVPEGTVKVLVNEYELSRFEPGSSTWTYNADTEYENLEIGENEYTIEAVSESGDKSSVTIKITYAPEEE